MLVILWYFKPCSETQSEFFDIHAVASFPFFLVTKSWPPPLSCPALQHSPEATGGTSPWPVSLRPTMQPTTGAPSPSQAPLGPAGTGSGLCSPLHFQISSSLICPSQVRQPGLSPQFPTPQGSAPHTGRGAELAETESPWGRGSVDTHRYCNCFFPSHSFSQALGESG